MMRAAFDKRRDRHLVYYRKRVQVSNVYILSIVYRRVVPRSPPRIHLAAMHIRVQGLPNWASIPLSELATS